MDLLMDSSSSSSSAMDGSSSSSSSNQKQNSFVSLLPPPPPRTTSKILPPPIPIQIRGNKSEVKLPPPPPHPPLPPLSPLLEEHLKDEEEWLGIKSIEKEGSSSSNLSSWQQQQPTIPFISRLIGSTPNAVGFTPHRIAPTVKIRSVIPVCTAPPLPQPPPPQETPPVGAANSEQLSTELKNLKL